MTKRKTGFGLPAIAAVLLMVMTVPRISAQDQDNDDNYQDPPARAGRVSFVNGSVSFQPGGQGDWVDAVPNRPLTTGDNLWADRDSRAEVQIGSTSIRLAPESSLTFLDLDNDVTQLKVSVGSVFFRVRRLDRDSSFEVDTPNLAFNVYQPGEYRVDVNENGDQTIARVFHGEAEITGGGDSYRLSEGQEGHFSGVDQLSYDVGGIGSQDDFERWCLDRDRREDSFRSSQYVSTDMTGYEDLDDYGHWHDVEGYGSVWTPTGVAGDWAPYRNGNWAYVSPWGWTWVEDEPWGFAPFHYGRWAYAGGGWCWVPGPVVARPVYSPALVAFVGGGGFSIGVGGGAGVGWFPLGPGEVYVPWYRTSPRYVQNVNVTNTRVTVVQVTNVYNNVTVNRVNNVTYVNQRAGRGITVVNHDTFVNARPVNRNIERVDVRRISSAPVTHEVARNIQPSRESAIGNAHVVRQAPPPKVMSRPVVATRQPVVRNQAGMPGGARPAPPAVRTVKPVPVSQAETLNRGAKGQSRGGNGGGPAAGGAANRPGAPANQPGANNRPGAPDNRPGTPANQPGANNRPGTPDNRPGSPAANDRGGNNAGAAAPRPGNPNPAGRPDRGEAAPRPENPNEPDRGAAPRPGNPDARPNGPANDNQPRPANPDNNRPDRNVPRPPSAGGEQPNRGAGAENRNSQPDKGRPDNRPSDARPDNSRPANPRPDNARPDNARPDNARPDNSRPDNGPAGQTREPRANAPDNRPAPPENRPAPPENRPSAAPDRRQASPPEPRDTPSPRQESRPAPPPQSRPEARPTERPESRPQREEPRNNNKSDGGNKNDKDNKDNKDRNKFR